MSDDHLYFTQHRFGVNDFFNDFLSSRFNELNESNPQSLGCSASINFIGLLPIKLLINITLNTVSMFYHMFLSAFKKLAHSTQAMSRKRKMPTK